MSPLIIVYVLLENCNDVIAMCKLKACCVYKAKPEADMELYSIILRGWVILGHACKDWIAMHCLPASTQGRMLVFKYKSSKFHAVYMRMHNIITLTDGVIEIHPCMYINQPINPVSQDQVPENHEHTA